MQYDEYTDDPLIEAQIGQNLKTAFPLPKDRQLPPHMFKLLNALRQKQEARVAKHDH